MKNNFLYATMVALFVGLLVGNAQGAAEKLKAATSETASLQRNYYDYEWHRASLVEFKVHDMEAHHPYHRAKRSILSKLLSDSRAKDNISGWTEGLDLLCLACQWGNLKDAQELMTQYKDKIDINASTYYNGLMQYTTPLAHAAYYGHPDLVKLLVDNGADANQGGVYHGEHTPYWWATHSFPATTSKEHAEIRELLVKHGAKVPTANKAAQNVALRSKL